MEADLKTGLLFVSSRTKLKLKRNEDLRRCTLCFCLYSRLDVVKQHGLTVTNWMLLELFHCTTLPVVHRDYFCTVLLSSACFRPIIICGPRSGTCTPDTVCTVKPTPSLLSL
jgi:hypothetical protein